MESFKEDYSKYTLADFLMNDDFKQWIKSSEEEMNEYWKSVQENFPEKTADMKVAIQLVKLLAIQQEAKHDAGKAKVWQAIEEKINAEPPQTIVRKLEGWKSFRRIAAILIPVLIAGGAWLYWGLLRPVKIVTAYGEVKTVILPDQSVVKLNGNSSVKYPKNWDKNTPREIWLDGEAFFEVQHLNKNDKKVSEHDRFIVHSGAVNIEVLGTSFNIRNRRGKIDVILTKGKIKVDLDKKSNAAVYMKPADKFEYDQQLNLIKKSVINAEVATSWKTGKLQLTDATVNEVIAYIEDNYGYQIHLSNQEIGKKQLEGVIFVDNLDDMLFALSTMLNVEVIKDGKKIELRERPR